MVQSRIRPRHHLRQAFSVGQTIRVAGHQGRVLEVTAAALILETDEGRVSLPGRVTTPDWASASRAAHADNASPALPQAIAFSRHRRWS